MASTISGFRWQLTNAADKVDGDAFRADAEDDALGFGIFGNQLVLLFLDRDYFGWFWHAHSIG